VTDALDQILKDIDYMRVLAHLEPKEKTDEIWCICPACKVKDAYIHKDGRAILCRRQNNCGATTTLLELVSGISKPRGSDFIRAIELLAERGGATYTARVLDPQAQMQIQRKKERADTLAAVSEYATEMLRADITTNGACAQYLNRRNFNATECLGYGFGYIRSSAELAAVVTIELAKVLGFASDTDSNGVVWSTAWDNRLLIPLRDIKGVVRGFAGRAIGDSKPKYINTKDTNISSLVAIELQSALGNSPNVIGVEGFLDPFKSRSNGICGVVGIGSSGSALSEDRWEKLYSFGVQQFTFITDNDLAGAKGLEKALAKADKAKKCPDIFVMTLPGAKDLDEWIDKTNANKLPPKSEFDTLYYNSIHADKFRARLFARNYDLSNESGRHAYLTFCLEYDASINDSKRIITLRQYFWPEVQGLVEGIPLDLILQLRADLRARKMQEEKGKAVQKLLVEVASLGTDADSALEKLRFQSQAIHQQYRLGYETSTEAPQTLLSKDLQFLAEASERDFLGIPQRSLPTIDELLSGLRGLCLVAGPTNIGKTILLCQWALEAVRQNNDVCCVFATLEMSPMTLRLRMLSYLSGISYKDMIRMGRNPSRELNDAIDILENQIMPKLKFLHHDEPKGFVFDTASVINEADALKAASKCNRVLVIADFMGIWPVDPEVYKTEMAQQQRQVEDMILLRDAVAPLGAVVAVVELRKSDGSVYTLQDVLGSSRIVYRADNCIILNPFNDEMLWRHFSHNNGYAYKIKVPHKEPLKDLKKEENQDIVNQVRLSLDKLGRSPLRIEVAKVRDGGRKGHVDVTTTWGTSSMQEGIHI